jgi:hypothetical protein
MGRKSRAKRSRASAPLGRAGFGGYRLDRSTLLFVGGVLLAAWGMSAMRYSRWDHTFNAHVQPIFHPWAILAGFLVIIYSIRSTRN